MLTAQDNETLARIGPGTPCGELLRRYWQPIAVAPELTEERPKKRVRLLGEDLVLYRTSEGGYGLVEEPCAHRRASLFYGFVEGQDLRCPYHGWKYAPDGQCVEQPFESNPAFLERTRIKAYPVRRLAGLIFAYLGPEPAPELPRWDVLERTDGMRKLRVEPLLNCNWLQPMENAVDTVHTFWLHGHSLHLQGLPGGEYYYRPIESYDFEQSQWGIVKRRSYRDPRTGELEVEEGHPLIFPNGLRLPQGRWHAFHWRVPIDDTHTQIYFAGFLPNDSGEPEAQPEDPEVEFAKPYTGPDGEYDLTYFESQDAMAWESQGALCDRTRERLGAEDRGITMYRKLLLEQMRVVGEGGDPIGVIRDPDRAVVHFRTSTGQARAEYLTPHLDEAATS